MNPYQIPGITMRIPIAGINGVQRELDTKGNLASNLTKPFKRMGVYLTKVTDRTFKEGGRPAGSWTPLSDYTLALRKHKGRGVKPKQILSIHGSHGLKGSFTAKVEPRGMKFGTNVPYAEKHQFGGSVKRPRTKITAKKGKALRFEAGGEVLFRKSVVLPEKTFKIPKRQMLSWLPTDDQELERLVAEHMKGD